MNADPPIIDAQPLLAADGLHKRFDQLEVHADAITPGKRVLVHDDVLATGGTAKATAELVEQLGGVVIGLPFIIELAFLDGRQKLAGYDVFSLVEY